MVTIYLSAYYVPAYFYSIWFNFLQNPVEYYYFSNFRVEDMGTGGW